MVLNEHLKSIRPYGFFSCYNDLGLENQTLISINIARRRVSAGFLLFMLHLFATISNETCYDITFDEIALSFGQIRNHLTQRHLFFKKNQKKVI